jgi:peptide subunit release factor 1 (eRF1)
MGAVLDHAVITSEPIRKADYGGWHGLDEHRSRNHAEEAIARHFGAVEQQLLEFHRRHQVEVIFVGGREETVKSFLGSLSDPIQQLVADTFVIDVHTATAAAVAATAAELEERYERRTELESIEATFDLARVGGLATIGLADTIAAINLSAVDYLLVQSGVVDPGWACPACGFLSVIGPDCAGCGGVSELKADILELIVARARAQRATIEHVTVPSGLQEHRVAARVRFRPMSSGAAETP